MAAAPGSNEDDGMQFEGPQLQQEPELGNQYIIPSSLINKIKKTCRQTTDPSSLLMVSRATAARIERKQPTQ
jgi:hypothetical protein